jgi:hypothetical protein
MPDTSAVPRHLVRWLWLMVGWTAVFLVVTTVQGTMRADFDSWHQAISALSLGRAGWIQSVNMGLFGLGLTASALPWRRMLRGGYGAIAHPVLTVMSGCSLVFAAFIPQDPAPGYDPANLHLTAPTLTGLLHLLFAAIAAFSSVASMFVIAKRLSRDPWWNGWPTYTRLVALLMMLCIGVYAFWSTSPSGFAGTFERLAVLLPTVWACTFAWRLWRGTPFMVAARKS